MISIDLIRNDPDQVRQGLAARGEDDPLDQILELDIERRSAVTERDDLRGERNQPPSGAGLGWG